MELQSKRYLVSSSMHLLIRMHILNKVLAHDALISPDHPFHEEGVDGVKMYMGVSTQSL